MCNVLNGITVDAKLVGNPEVTSLLLGDNDVSLFLDFGVWTDWRATDPDTLADLLTTDNAPFLWP